MFNKKSEARKTAQTTDVKKTAFDYQTVKAQANDLEREGRWLEAAAAWTTIADQSTGNYALHNTPERLNPATI